MICKLYQSAAIFELVGILEKTKNSGEFKICDEFYSTFNEDPTFIPSLLNRPTEKSNFLEARAQEFSAPHLKKKKHVHKKKIYTYDDYSPEE